MSLALRERRVLLTEDKDFGQLVYANAEPSGGVIFIRYPADTRKTLPNAMVSLIAKAQTQLFDSFVWTHEVVRTSDWSWPPCREQAG